MKYLLFLFLSLHLLGQETKINSILDKINEQSFTGFSLYEDNNPIIEYQSDKYFTPASNVKILTLYTALKYLPDSLMTVVYGFENDILYLQGVGDPTLFLSPYSSKNFVELCSKAKEIVFNSQNFKDDIFGAGWSWEDFENSFQAERNSLPINANNFSYINPYNYYPQFKIEKKHNTFKRDLHTNTFNLSQNSSNIPFITSDSLIIQLLSNTLNKKVKLGDFPKNLQTQYLYSNPKKPILETMIQKSDNFFAEQLLLMSSYITFNELNSLKMIDYLLLNDFKKYNSNPRWVDGSGLSRYNLFSPNFFVKVLNEIKNQPKFLDYFAVNARTGTLKNAYNSKTKEAYIFAKTGSLGGIYALSGYIKTDKSKLLTFSILCNNFRIKSSDIKDMIETLLYTIKTEY